MKLLASRWIEIEWRRRWLVEGRVRRVEEQEPDYDFDMHCEILGNYCDSIAHTCDLHKFPCRTVELWEPRLALISQFKLKIIIMTIIKLASLPPNEYISIGKMPHCLDLCIFNNVHTMLKLTSSSSRMHWPLRILLYVHAFCFELIFDYNLYYTQH